jgi:glycerol kinase
MRVLAIDQGTSGTKALVVDGDGSVLAEEEVPVHPVALDDAHGAGGVEQDPEELWESIIVAGHRALDAAQTTVDAVALSNQGETVLPWDRATGAPLAPALVWQDRRAADLCTRLAADGWDERLARITGLELDPYFVAPKVAWIREHITTDGVVTTSDTWLLHRLCDAYVTDAATASRSLLLDLDRVDWSSEACGAFGIDPATLPTIVPCDARVGETRMFTDQPLPVIGLAVDQQAALFAEGCLSAGEAKCTYGTGAFLLATIGPEARRSHSGLVACIAWTLIATGGSTTYCLDGQVYTVGAAVQWLTNLGLIAAPADLDRLGASVRDAGGVTFVPGLAGLAAPFWKPEARGAFTGLSLATGRPEMVRAVLEGIAAQCAWLARAAGDDLGAPLTRLRVDGGLTRSTVLMQLQADLLQAPVEVYASPHATALGVAALARLGGGAAADPCEAIGTWTPAAVYEPSVSADEAGTRLDAWRAAADAVLDL